MTFAFGSKPYFNIGSPTNSVKIVQEIVNDFSLSPKTSNLNSIRILDVGGTPYGFKKKASLNVGAKIILVNPDPTTGAEFSSIENVPQELDESRYDFAMMMGMLMFLSEDELYRHFQSVRARLKNGGWFLVAEPDPEKIVISVDHCAKNFLCRLRRKKPYIAYTLDKTIAVLRNAGFVHFEVRPDLAGKTLGSFFIPGYRRYYVIAAR